MKSKIVSFEKMHPLYYYSTYMDVLVHEILKHLHLVPTHESLKLWTFIGLLSEWRYGVL